MHAMMYGNMNRGMGGQPQPQRQGGGRRNRNFRNSRFDQPHQQNRNVQQPNRNDNRTSLNNVDVKANNEPAKPVQTPKPVQQNDAQAQSKPAQNQQQQNQQQQNQQQQNQQQQNQQQQNLQQQNQPKPQTQPQQIQQKLPQTPQQKPTPLFQQQQKPPQVQQKSPAMQQQPAQQAKPAVQQPKQQAQQNVAPAQAQQPPQQIPVQQTQHHQQGNEQNGPDNLNTNQNQQKRPGGRFGGQNTSFGSGGHGGNFGSSNQGQGGNFAGGQGGGQGNFAGGQGGNFGSSNQGGNFGGQGGGNFGANKQAGGPRNMRQGGRGQDGNKMGGPNTGREEHILAAKLKDLTGPLTELPPVDQAEVKFNGRSRMYIGNLSSDITEQEIQDLFTPFGETSELFVNKEKNFAFIRLDFRANAEKAKRELDGHMRRGRPLRIRFAPHNSAVKVRNLTPFVSNELLYKAFEIFGKIERAYVKVDDRGKTLGEGVVEFARKASALSAIRNCTEKCFFLTSSLRPVIVESYEEPEELDGYQEKNLPKKHPDFMRARELGPRFSEHNSFEHEYGTRWKQMHELYRQKEETLHRERAAEEDKLDAQMEFAKYEHETEMLREQLRQREQDRDRQKRSWEMAERAADERLDVDRAQVLRQEEELAGRMRRQEEELRRRQQENTLFMQAQHLNSMLDQQEQGMFDSKPQMDGGYMEQYDMGRGYDDMMGSQRWDSQRHPEDFPNKRRRY